MNKLIAEAELIDGPTRRKMPAQKPGLSKQNYKTPDDFIAAVEHRFGNLTFDLAAQYHNKRATQYFGDPRTEMVNHGGCVALDSLAQDWTSPKLGKNLWLNPEYADIKPWASKCALATGATKYVEHVTVPLQRYAERIFFLVPASVGAEWFARHVFGQALVLFLVGRISFDGKAPYPKDCILAVYGEKPGFELWRWR